MRNAASRGDFARSDRASYHQIVRAGADRFGGSLTRCWSSAADPEASRRA